MPPRPRSRPRPRYRSRYARPIWPGVLAGLVIVALLAGGAWYFLRGRLEGPQLCPAAGAPVTFALGARANMPVPTLPAVLRDLIRQAADEEQPIAVYRVDGDPTAALRETFHSTTKADAPRDREVDQFVENVVGRMGEIRSSQPEADPLRALWLAARDTPVGGTVVLFDSGLQTAPPLDFRDEGMLEAEPADVVARLRDTEALPALRGRRVILMGLGDTIAPQQNLPLRMHENLIDIWSSIVDAGGPACVEVMPNPPAAMRALPGVKNVTPVRIPQPPPPPEPCEEVRLSNGGEVGFRPDQDILRDEAAAHTFLQNYAKRILDTKQRVQIIGTTARRGPRDGQIDLAGRRAAVVKRLLVDLGVPADWITTTGVGSYSTYYREDGGPDGPLDPAAAAFNRSVVVKLLCP